MPISPMTLSDLRVARAKLDGGNVAEFYEYIATFGHRYPELALGVYREAPPSGIVALAFMRQTALQVGRDLSRADANQIKTDMAEGYFAALAAQTDKSGVVVREVSANETWAFHSSVFRKHDLPQDAWTLNTPFKLYGNDNAARETFWRGILDGQSSLLHEAYIGNRSYALIWAVGYFSADPAVKAEAQAWMNRVNSVEAVSVQAPLFATWAWNGIREAVRGGLMSLPSPTQVLEAVKTHLRELGFSVSSLAPLNVDLAAAAVTNAALGETQVAGPGQDAPEGWNEMFERVRASLAGRSVDGAQLLVRDGEAVFLLANGDMVTAQASGGVSEFELSVASGQVASITATTDTGTVLVGAGGELLVVSAASGHTQATAYVGGTSLGFTGTVRADGTFGIASLTHIDGEALPQPLGADELAAFGITFEDIRGGRVPGSASVLIDGVDPRSAAASGWPTPKPIETPIPQGFTRTLELPNGFTLTSTYDSDRRLIEVTESFSRNATTQHIQTFAINADGSRSLRTTAVREYAPDSSYIQQEIDAATGDIYQVVGDTDHNVTRTLDTSAMRLRDQQRAVTIYSDVMGLTAAIRAGKPLPALASGVRLINDLSIASNVANTNLAAASTVAAGYLSFYNLYNAFDTGSDFDRINSSLTALNYANEAFSIVGGTGGTVSNFLNGTGNLQAGGAVGALAVVGLITSLKEGDAIGAAISLGSMASATFLSTNFIGWALLAANVMRSFFADDRPQAWGVASVTFGAGFDLSVQADGEAFGPDQARARLQSIVDTLQGLVADNNARQADSAQHLGIIPQRLPGLSFRAADFQDKGFAVQDIDALSGAQRMPALRFASDGQPFGLASDAMSEQDRAMLTLDGAPQVEPLMAYMLNSALQRGAIAPQWEVRTAQLQQQVGDPNAGLMEEERAAKAGLAAPVDAAYAAAHPDDAQAANRRQGRFMPVGVDLSGDGRIATRTLEQTAGTDIRFDWDGQGYQKRTGWIGQEDGFLVLDHDFNQSVDTAKELFSNPLVAEAGKGLRLLAAYDANGDGRIDAQDPVYEQLRVWQDLDQDGDNTRMATVSGQSVRVQDETNGVGELRTLRELGISAIDYANQRFERGGGWGLIATQALQAEDEGQRYTPVGAGVQIEWSDAAPQIVLTAVQSEAAVYRLRPRCSSKPLVWTRDPRCAASQLEQNQLKAVH